MKKSEQINELALALSKAQLSIKGALEDSSNPHFRSNYASLKSYIDSAKEALSKNGLAITQLIQDSDYEGMNSISVETFLMHSSGQWISSIFSMPVSKLDAQGVGSAITYARRYSFAATIGIAPMEDDDGNQAVNAAPKQEKNEKNNKKQQEIPNDVLIKINSFEVATDLIDYATSQKTLHKNPEFRALVQNKLEEIKENIKQKA